MSTKTLDFLFEGIKFDDYCAVYGEWCGGNIQKGVALNQLPKMFIIFGVKVDDKWIDISEDLQSNEIGIYNILQFGTYEIEIDFNSPELSQNKLIDMTISVEDCCPIGKFFGVEGVGEGIVFECTTDPSIQFKSKGQKHSASKVKVLNPAFAEKMEGVHEVANSVATENRFLQGIAYFNENNIDVSIKNIGTFIGWVVKDVLKEESDTISVSGADESAVKSAIVQKAKAWFFQYLKTS